MVQALEERFVGLIAATLGCRPKQVASAEQLFAEGATVPFVARYRKEATGGLIDAHLEEIARQRTYFIELAERRDAILESMVSQGKLTPELEARIREAVAKQDLEDIYLPFKPKRRTRAQIAREKGLEPLAAALVENARGGASPAVLAHPFIDAGKGVPSAEDALAGARDILAEQFAEDAGNRARLRGRLSGDAMFHAAVAPGKEEEGKVYRDYFDHREAARSIPSHRLLAILRGEREGFLSAQLEIDDEREIAGLGKHWGAPLNTPCGRELAAAAADGYKRLLRPSIDVEVRADLRLQAEKEAIQVFRSNLEALLLLAPLGQVPVLGLDPGYRTGCKVAAVDRTGKVVATSTIFPVPPRADPAGAAETLIRLIRAHQVRAVAIGNGTGSRETEQFARQAVRAAKVEGVIVAIVPETGASVYSASTLAREELPDLDVSLRGAASIARRMQDPLAELVKIDPRSLGVGQYQHDVNQKALETELDTAVEGVVNKVGVELNTASASLLRRVSGLSERLAKSIVEFRNRRGSFSTRRALLEVAGFGPKTFELAAGFLRLREADHPLDATAVHPERYDLVEFMALENNVPLKDLVGNPALVARLDFNRFKNESAGLGSFTLADIRAELERPGRDPRPEYKAPEWRDDVQSIDDLKPGMVLEGRVSNVTNFGAFVDIGVKRDGLIHLSELSSRWIKDPREVVQTGQIVRVQVLEIDRDRERIQLSMKKLAPASASPAAPAGTGGGAPTGRR